MPQLYPQEKQRLIALTVFFMIILAFATALNIYSLLEERGVINDAKQEALGISDEVSD